MWFEPGLYQSQSGSFSITFTLVPDGEEFKLQCTSASAKGTVVGGGHPTAVMDGWTGSSCSLLRRGSFDYNTTVQSVGSTSVHANDGTTATLAPSSILMTFNYKIHSTNCDGHVWFPKTGQGTYDDAATTYKVSIYGARLTTTGPSPCELDSGTDTPLLPQGSATCTFPANEFRLANFP